MRTARAIQTAFMTTLAAGVLASPIAPARASAPEYGKLPLAFEINRGQTDGRVKFVSRGDGYTLFLTSHEAVLSLQPRHGAQAALRMTLKGSNRVPRIEGVDPLPGKSNYFIGNDPKKWRTDVPTFAKVRYRDVYPGVDVVYYGNQRTLENDFIVAPGTSPGAIALAFTGASTIAVDGAGSLVLGLPGGDVRLQKPVMYQVSDGVRHAVAGNYVIKKGRAVGFDVAAYDTQRPLVIDPLLVYSSYLGGNGTEAGNAIVVDDQGNAYVTGTTTSSLFPLSFPYDSTLSGSSDVFVIKISPSGTALIYSTYLGGSSTDSGSDISVDGSYNVYLTGRTSSSDFPAVNAYDTTYSGGTDEDVFVTRINAAGSALVYSTYLSGTFGARGVGIFGNNSQSYAYVIGTTSTGFPVTAGAFESTNFNSGFLTKLCTNCVGAASLVYSTFLAHTGTLEGRSVVADVGGNAYVTGNLGSSATSFATAGAFQTAYGGGSSDVFIAKFNTNLSGAAGRVYATYLGGSGKDSVADSSGNSGKAIQIDGVGDVFVTGATGSTNFPLANAYQGILAGLNDVFLSKLDPAGASLLYSTYLGGTGDDFGRSVATNVAGQAYVTGVAGPGFPVVASLPMPNPGVGFVTKFASSGAAVVYSTLLSGVSNGSFGIALDDAGNAFATGGTNASIVTQTPFQPTNGGGGTDGWVSVIADPAIIGRVLNETGGGLAGATVDLTGSPSGTTTTDASGGYAFGFLTIGNSYTVTASAPNYSFNQPSAVNNLQKNARRDAPMALTLISGQVTLGAAALSGTTITISGGKSLTFQTDFSGNYLAFGLPIGRDYTVTPTKAGFTFSPSSRSYTNVQTLITGADFAATPAVSEASLTGHMTVSKGAGTSVNVAYTPACGALTHVVYRGASPISAGLVWNAAYCGLGTSGSLSFDPGTPSPGSFWYFVVVGQGASTEGSYGRTRAAVEEPEAVGVGACDLPQVIGSCP